MKRTYDAHEAEAVTEPEVEVVEAEKLSPKEEEHLRRLRVLRHVRDEALVASRQLDVHRLAQAVHDLAALLHDEMIERAGPKTK